MAAIALLLTYAFLLVVFTAALIRRRRNRNERGEVMVRRYAPAEEILEEIFSQVNQ